MPRSRSFLLTILSATATIGLLALTAPQVASATVTPTAAAGGEHAGYQSSNGTAASPSTVSPSGCVQYSDRPHGSVHFDGRMNASVRAMCRSQVPKLSHSAQMWETRWWGWDRIGIKGYVTRIYSTYAKAYGNDSCKDNSVRVTGYGYIVDVDARTYYASTVSVTIKNPCGL
jgi:hypothetical protein